MFFHNLKYSLKSLIKNKGLLFWTFLFPLLMATLFNMAFGNWVESEKFESIDIAIIKNSYYEDNKVAKRVFESISSGEDRVFNITYVSDDVALKLLNDDKIVGYIKYYDGGSDITVKSNGVSATIIKSVVDEIDTYNVMFNDLVEKEMVSSFDIDKAVTDAINRIENIQVKTKDVSVKKLDIAVIEYYSLLSMTCLYGGFIALTCISNSLVSISSRGKRVEVAPTKKSVIILSSLLSSFIVQMIGALLLLAYLKLIGVNLYANVLGLMVVTVLGVLAGIALGLLISVVNNKNEGVKFGIVIAVSMACSVLAGLTGVSLKYVVDSNFPIINKINPAAMITDGLYALYYEDISRFNYNMISLIIFVVVLVFISVVSLRRKKYDSI